MCALLVICISILRVNIKQMEKMYSTLNHIFQFKYKFNLIIWKTLKNYFKLSGESYQSVVYTIVLINNIKLKLTTLCDGFTYK